MKLNSWPQVVFDLRVQFKKLKNTGMPTSDWYILGVVELGTSNKTAVKIDQKNAQYVQELIKILNTDVENTDIAKEWKVVRSRCCSIH